MKKTYHIIKTAAAALAGALAVSCGDSGEAPEVGGPDSRAGVIRVNTQAVVGSRNRVFSGDIDNTFMVLFWKGNSHLESPANNSIWPAPYLAAQAPQHVDFYRLAVFDTHYPYPDTETEYLYATGYAPGGVLDPDATQGYRRLTLTANNTDKGRYDVLGCDAWSDVYKGSKADPFAQDKNKLYFRHLASKLVFFADRDRNTMENKQYVRNVRISRLYMSIDGGTNYTSMYTPNVLEWKSLETKDFTAPYTKALEEVRLVNGNQSVTSLPTAGYKAVEAEPFAGDDTEFVLSRHNADRVPVAGMFIDSCYVCNNIQNGVVQTTGQRIRLKMDISAEMSFNPNFPMPDSDGSVTDDMTFTRTWKDVKLDAIYRVDEKGKATTETVSEFRPGMEYRIYLKFYRSGVNLVAIEQPWEIGGVHYITISGSNPQPGT